MGVEIGRAERYRMPIEQRRAALAAFTAGGKLCARHPVGGGAGRANDQQGIGRHCCRLKHRAEKWEPVFRIRRCDNKDSEQVA
jgi:hypothetical protein